MILTIGSLIFQINRFLIQANLGLFIPFRFTLWFYVLWSGKRFGLWTYCFGFRKFWIFWDFLFHHILVQLLRRPLKLIVTLFRIHYLCNNFIDRFLVYYIVIILAFVQILIFLVQILVIRILIFIIITVLNF